jgi:glutathione S-transferase
MRRASIAEVLTLYDAARCPYCARVRIVLAEKRLPYEPVEVDLADRPAWIYGKNRTGLVPVLEENGALLLPESRVIMEYLEERYPEPALLPLDPAERALVRLRFERFARFSGPYYDTLRGRAPADGLLKTLAELDADLEAQPFLGGTAYGLADIAYVPWVLRAESRLGIDLGGFPALADWRERLAERPAVAAELELVAALA